MLITAGRKVGQNYYSKKMSLRHCGSANCEPLSVSFQGWKTVWSLKSLLHKLEDLRLTLTTPVKNATCGSVIFNPRAGEETGGSVGVGQLPESSLVSSMAMRHYVSKKIDNVSGNTQGCPPPSSREHTRNMSTHRF